MLPIKAVPETSIKRPGALPSWLPSEPGSKFEVRRPAADQSCTSDFDISPQRTPRWASSAMDRSLRYAVHSADHGRT